MKEYLEEIYVTEFDDDAAEKFRKQVIQHYMADKKAVIKVYINSYGGEVESLAAMIETMKSVPNTFHTICLGKAYSCGAILLSFGDIRSMGQLSTAMIHEISSGAHGSSSEMEISTNEIKRQNKLWLTQFAKNCGTTYKKLMDKINGRDLYLTAKQAKHMGLVQRLMVPKPSLEENKINIKETKTNKKDTITSLLGETFSKAQTINWSRKAKLIWKKHNKVKK